MSNLNYFTYLKTRSKISLIFRNTILYPRLSSFLSGKVLDVGCGIGDFLAYRKNTIGLDVNEFNVDYCNQNGNSALLIQSHSYPFDSNSFDGAILDNVLEHLEEPERILEEIHRVVKDGGRLIVGVPGKKGYSKDSDHKIFYNEDLLEKTLSNAGFSLVNYVYSPLFIKSKYLSNYLNMYCIYGVFCCNK